MCDVLECFEDTLGERHRSAEIRRVKVSFRGAQKLPACLRNAQATSAGVLFRRLRRALAQLHPKRKYLPNVLSLR